MAWNAALRPRAGAGGRRGLRQSRRGRAGGPHGARAARAIGGAGLFALAVPSEHGGHGAAARPGRRGRGDRRRRPSAAWHLSNTIEVPLAAAHLDGATREEIFAADLQRPFCVSNSPGARRHRPPVGCASTATGPSSPASSTPSGPCWRRDWRPPEHASPAAGGGAAPAARRRRWGSTCCRPPSCRSTTPGRWPPPCGGRAATRSACATRSSTSASPPPGGRPSSSTGRSTGSPSRPWPCSPRARSPSACSGVPHRNRGAGGRACRRADGLAYADKPRIQEAIAESEATLRSLRAGYHSAMADLWHRAGIGSLPPRRGTGTGGDVPRHRRRPGHGAVASTWRPRPSSTPGPTSWSGRCATSTPSAWASRPCAPSTSTTADGSPERRLRAGGSSSTGRAGRAATRGVGACLRRGTARRRS